MSEQYRSLFQQQTERSLRYLLGRIEWDERDVLSSENQQILLSALPHAVRFPALWPLTSTLLLLVAPKMEQAGHRELWIPHLEEGLHLSESLYDDKTKAALHFHLGVLYHLRNLPAEAITHFKSSADCNETLADSFNQARALHRWAYVARCQRHYAEATTLVERARALLAEDASERGYSNFMFGILAYDRADYRQAATWFQRSLAIWEHENDQRMIAWNLTNLGTAWQGLQDYDAAMDVYERAIAIFQAIHDPANQAIAEMNLGNIHLMRQAPALALDAYLTAEPVLRQLLDELNLTRIYTNKGIAYRQLQQWQQATDTLVVAIENWEHLGNFRSLANAMMELGLVYFDQGDMPKAIRKFHRALACLEQMRDEPGYAALVEEVTGHLNDAVQKR